MRLEWPLIGSVFLVLVRRCVSVDTLRIYIPIDSKCNVFPCAHVSTFVFRVVFSFSLPVLSMLTVAKASPEFRSLNSNDGRCPECHGFFGVISSFSSTLEWSDLSFCRFCRFGRCPDVFQIFCVHDHIHDLLGFDVVGYPILVLSFDSLRRTGVF